ncbi:hypothetical protein KVV02_001625 [Mortierella alpina]|uniref:Uncharacterized protein n=1 Tax=Mortierella alpina TaxID=64518 RepID=A0A9P8ABN2_MORAP|nr:hypothetical protein KVV02_001625 [Mortierella alpina]
MAVEEEILAAMKNINSEHSRRQQADEKDIASADDNGHGVILDVSNAPLRKSSSSSHHNRPQSMGNHRRQSHRQQDSVVSIQQIYYHHSYRDEDLPLRHHSHHCYHDDQPAISSQPGQLQLQIHEGHIERRYSEPLSTSGFVDGEHSIDQDKCVEELDNHSTEKTPISAAVETPRQLMEDELHALSGEAVASTSTRSSLCESSATFSSPTSSPMSSPVSSPTIVSPPRPTAQQSHPSTPQSTIYSYSASPSSAPLYSKTATSPLSESSRLAFESVSQSSPAPLPDFEDMESGQCKNMHALVALKDDEDLRYKLPPCPTRQSTASDFVMITLNGERIDLEDPFSDGSSKPATSDSSTMDPSIMSPVILPTSKQAQNVLLATILLAWGIIALEAVLLIRHQDLIRGLMAEPSPFEVSSFRSLTVYYSIFILAKAFSVALLWDAAIHKNSLQLVAFTIFEWCTVSYSGLQIWQHDQLVRDIGVPVEDLVALGDPLTRALLFLQLAIQIAACLGITLLTSKLYYEFGWLVFQKLGADVSLRKMMKEYRLLFTILKLDAFFFIGYAILVATLTGKNWKMGLIDMAFAVPLSCIIILLGYYAMRHENKVIMGGFIACLGLLIAYMIFRIVALYQVMTGDPTTDPYFYSRKTMTVFAALTLLMTQLALVYAIVMLYNFNRGLKEAMRQYNVRRSGTIRSVTPSHRTSNASFQVPAAAVVGAERVLQSSRRNSRRSTMRCESSMSGPVIVERWNIE